MMLGSLPPIAPPRPNCAQKEWDRYEDELQKKFTIEITCAIVLCASLLVSIAVAGLLFLKVIFGN